MPVTLKLPAPTRVYAGGMPSAGAKLSGVAAEKSYPSKVAWSLGWRQRSAAMQTWKAPALP